MDYLKGIQGNFLGDGNALCPDWGDGYSSICICQKSLSVSGCIFIVCKLCFKGREK